MRFSKKVLVTGGAGFIGTHLCERLVSEGCDVICLDNFFTGSRDNIASLQKNNKFKLIVADVCQPIDLKVDEIYNLACPASPVHYQSDPIQTTRTNVVGALSVLNLAKRCNAKVLQASTSEVYGDPEIHPQSENYWGNVNPVGARSCYDEGKRCAETLFTDYYLQHGTDIKIARIFNTYGPNMHINDGRVVSNFIVNSLRGEPLNVNGQGSQTRSFQYVDDLIEGLVSLMYSQDFHEPVNLGNPEEMNIIELAKLISSLCGSNNNVNFNELPSDDPKRRKPDIRLAKKVLNWQPTINIEEGLKLTIPYFRTKLDTL